MLNEQDLSYRARAAEQLRTRILSGELASGARLNEVELARQLGISRGPLREAIQSLAAQGLVTIEPHRGGFVRGLSAEQIPHLYEVRSALEQAIAARLARTRTDDTVRQLEDLLRASAAARELHHGGYPCDLDFHTTLGALCGNPDLAAVNRGVTTQLGLARGRSGHDPGRAALALAEHHAIADAIARGNDLEAAAAMRIHLEHSCASILAQLAGRSSRAAETPMR